MVFLHFLEEVGLSCLSLEILIISKGVPGYLRDEVCFADKVRVAVQAHVDLLAVKVL